MEYATVENYTNIYSGMDIPEDELEKLLIKASRDIDALTEFKIDFEKLSEINKKRVMLATCSHAEHLAHFGETIASVGPNMTGFSIGSYSESGNGKPRGYSGQAKYSVSISDRFSQATLGYLWPTGLLYGGVTLS